MANPNCAKNCNKCLNKQKGYDNYSIYCIKKGKYLPTHNKYNFFEERKKNGNT